MKKRDGRGHLDWQDFMTDKIRQCFRDYGFLALKKDILNFLAEIEYSGDFNWESFRANLYEVIRDISLIIKDGDEIIFTFKCVAPIVRLNNDDLNLEVVIKSDRFSFVLDDRSL